MSEGRATTCPYCGVGCGVVAEAGAVVADPAHPSNRGRLCSKGAALAETLEDKNRLLHPRIDGERASWDEALALVATRFAETIASDGPDAVAFYVSGQFLTEDYYVANKLMKGFIGSANIDTNSRLCMASSVAGHKRAFGADIVPCVYEDFEEADLVVLVGANAAWCHPVIHQRLLAARERRGSRLVVIDPRRTATAEEADLVLPLAPGSDVVLFAGLLVDLADRGLFDDAWVAQHTSGLDAALAQARVDAGSLDAVAAATELDPVLIARFYRWFAETPRSLTLYSQGVNQSSSGTDKVNAILNVHLATARIGRPGMGPFSLTGQPNAMGGREVGGLATTLAAHMDIADPGDRDRVRRFWNAPRLALRPGLAAVALFDAVAEGRVKALWIAATNPAASMPRAGRVREALARIPFLVVSDCWQTDTSAFADVVLPAAAWGEKDGTVTSSERRISRNRAFRAAPGEARPDWWAFAELGRRLGFADAFAWEGPAAIFREHAALTAFENGGRRVLDLGGLAGLSDADYEALPPVRWPVAAGGGEGGRLFAEGGFQTPDGRARLVATPYRAVARGAEPFLLNTGRVRDQWHTMTRTGRVAKLMAHTPEPLLALHPEDALELGLGAGDPAEIATAHGRMVLQIACEPAQRRGEVFAAMHWTDQFSSAGPVARLVSGVTDPVSLQPELKATGATITPLLAHWRGLLLTLADRPPPGVWTRVPVGGGVGSGVGGGGTLFRLIGVDPLPATAEDFAASLLGAPEGAEILVLGDPARQVLRLAALDDGRLAGFLALGPDRAALPPVEWLGGLLGTPIPEATRLLLLAGRAPGAASTGGAVLCACFGVLRGDLTRAVAAEGLDSVAAVGRHLRAGTGCGSCIPEIGEVLRDVHRRAA